MCNLSTCSRTGKDGKKIIKTIFYKLEITDSARFMTNSLSNLIDNFPEGIHRRKCKYDYDNKISKHVELNTKIVSSVFNTHTLKMIS